jgi:hypothetical protein
MGAIVTKEGKLGRPSGASRASDTCNLCDDRPTRCREEFVCDVCGRTLQTCSHRVGGFGRSPDGRDVCVTCWEREAIVKGLLPLGWDIEGALNEHERREARKRAMALAKLLGVQDGTHTDG